MTAPTGAATLADLLQRTSISDIVVALGGGPVRGGRCRAWYRDGGDARSLALDDARGVFFDYGLNFGGGELDLIALGNGCGKRGAANWLADYHGVRLAGEALPPAERARLARQRSAAKAQAADLLDWRLVMVRDLRTRRNRAWDGANATERGLSDPDDPATWTAILQAERLRQHGDGLDELADYLMQLEPARLAHLREVLGASNV